ncbi:hypothetical protein [Embleya sp. MST-111070]|uniref:hypothetical protein n=1 Tax=Embleya sp. MST-111070 TaxID=3398231 RepID=UPI003F74183A
MSRSTRTGPRYMVTATWEAAGRTAVPFTSNDRAAVRRVAREHTARGARVTVAEYRGGTWRTLDVPDRAAEQPVARVEPDLDDDADQVVDEQLVDQAEHELRLLDRLMRERPAVRPSRARHTAGGRRAA